MVEQGNDLFPQGGKNQNGQNGKDERNVKKVGPDEKDLKIKMLEDEISSIKEFMLGKNGIKGAENTAGGQDALIKALTESIRGLSQPQELQYDPKKYFRPESIDKDDFLDKADVFVAFANFYVIGDDRRNGFPVPSPYGFPIEFTLAQTKIVRVGRADQIMYFALYKSHSRKISKWLREHSCFGRKFFEWDEMKDKKSYDKISKIAKWAEALDDIPVVRIKQMCDQHGVKFYPDNIRQSKLSLVEKLSDEELAKDLEQQDILFKTEKMKRFLETDNARQIAESSEM